MRLTQVNAILLALLLVMLTAAWAIRIDPARPNMEVLPDMQYSPAYDAFSPNPNFPNGQTQQPQPVGTIARGQLVLHYEATKEDAVRAGQELVNPIVADDPAALQRGAEVFRVYCAMCHGGQGLGDGPVAKRGYPPPPSLLTGNSLKMKDGQLFHILSYGQGSMDPYASQVSPDDRWQVITYVRDLQAQAAAEAAETTAATPDAEPTENEERQPPGTNPLRTEPSPDGESIPEAGEKNE